MQIKQKNINKIFKEQKIYSVPLFQREYTWGNEEVGTLLVDLLDFSKKFNLNKLNNNNNNKKNKNDYFLGTFVVQQRDWANNTFFSDYDLIDGQQRLTTFFLFKYVLLDIGRAKNFMDNDYNQVKSNLFFRNGSAKSELFKLHNKRETDSSFKDKLYSFVINNDNFETNYKENYDQMYSVMDDIIKSKSDYIFWTNDILDNLTVAFIEINNEQDSGSIFESINFKGKTLNFLDLIKNKLFLENNKFYRNIDRNNITNFNKLYAINENKIEQIISKISNFTTQKNKNNLFTEKDEIKNQELLLRIILQLTFNRDFNESTTVKNFRKFKDSLASEENNIKDLNDFSEWIDKLSISFSAVESLNAIMSHETKQSFYFKALLKKSLALIVPISAILQKELLNNNIDKNYFISENVNEIWTSNLIKISKKIYEIIFKKSIINDGFLGTNLWKVFFNFNKNLENNEFETVLLNLFLSIEEQNEIFEKKYMKLNQKFEKNLLIIDIYKSDRKLLKHIFLLMENELSLENNEENSLLTIKQLHNKFDANIPFIERIIPIEPKPDTEWFDLLSDYEYNALVNRIGNLTFSNSKFLSEESNLPFKAPNNEDKISLFLETKLKLNIQLSNKYTKFTFAESKERANWLLSIIKKILD